MYFSYILLSFCLLLKTVSNFVWKNIGKIDLFTPSLGGEETTDWCSFDFDKKKNQKKKKKKN